MSDYKFYMQECYIHGVPTENAEIKDLEADFDGLLYVKCEGIDTIGKAKNIYEETYSDADRLRVFHPSEVMNEATTIVLTLLFAGENRASVRDLFNEYIRKGYHKYWDTARNKEFVFYVKDELSVAEEKWHGGKPYLKCEYKLRNVQGKTTKKQQ